MLKAAYFPDTDFLEAQVGNKPSQIWRAIIDGKDVLQQGLIRRIGNGESTHAWNQNWLPRDFILRPMACSKPNPPVKVSDFIDHSNASWKNGKLEEFFIPMDVQVIKSIPLSTVYQEDYWSWQYDKSGLFSVRSAYKLLVHTKNRREDWLDGRANSSATAADEKQWTKLWKTPVPSKLRVFLWRLGHQSLPMSDVRYHRNMADNCLCSICGNPDSWRHSLIDCIASRSVWALADR